MTPQVPAATRTLSILRALAASAKPMTATGLSKQLGIPRSSTYHLLTAMEEAGFVTHYPEDERWGLGVAAFEIGSAYGRQTPLRQLGTPLLSNLVKDLAPLSVASHIGVLHGAQTLYIAKVESRKTPEVVTDIGVRLPAVLTATGRAMLALLNPAGLRAVVSTTDAFVDRTGKGPQNLRDLRELLRLENAQGFAREDSFIAEGFTSIAIGISDSQAQPLAAIGVTCLSEDLSSAQVSVIVRGIKKATVELRRRLGVT